MTPEELDRLVKMTPEAVVEAAAKVLLMESPDFFVGLRQFGDARTHSHLTNSLVGRGGCGWDCAECHTILAASSRILRAALPLLVAPERAKREQAERERDHSRKTCDTWYRNYLTVADAVARDSTGPEDLAAKARAIRADADTADRERRIVVAERDRLRAALEKYGHHTPDCAKVTQHEHTEPECTCGYRAALGGTNG